VPNKSTSLFCWLEDAHHSTAIEGNMLVLKQVEALLAEAERSATRSWASTSRCAVTPQPPIGFTVTRSSRVSSGEALVSLTELRHVHELARRPSPHRLLWPGMGARHRRPLY
jgi:hypothetical protein